jgi:hypothetical protein
MSIESWRAELTLISNIVDAAVNKNNGAAGAASPSVTDVFSFVSSVKDAIREADAEPSDQFDFEAELKHLILRACKTVEGMTIADSSDTLHATTEAAPLPRDRALMRRTLETLHYVDQAFGAASAAWKVAAAHDGQPATIDDLVAGISKFSTADPGEANRVQKLILYLLNVAQTRGYRRRNGEMYRRISAPGDLACYDTHAWQRVCDMQEFVYESCRKEVNYEMWSCLTWAKVNMVSAIDYLQSCRDVQLPDLKKDRHVFSFEDGVYLADKDRFCAYGTPEHSAIPTDVVAAKYFPLKFGPTYVANGGADSADSWYVDIKTPHVQTILDFQDMPEEVSRWMYVLLGRMLYQLNEKDRWSVIPYLKGAASSGKSTILEHVCAGFYEPEDVGTLSNNIEKKFGISAFADKFIFIGPEIKGDMKLDQAEFQSMVSGESVQVAVKNKTAHSQKWTAPGALAGNEVPNWSDNNGSLDRRMIILEFPKQVHKSDMTLGTKIDEEIPAILLKCNRAYLNAVRLYAKNNIWNHLPEQFHSSKDDLTESVNSIVSFLRCGQLDFGDDLYMPLENFISAYEIYTNSMGLQRIRFSMDKFSHPLMQVNCRVTKDANTVMRYPRDGSSTFKGKFVIGCDMSRTRHQNVCIDDGLG